MRRTALLAAVLGGIMASSSFAAFTVTYQKTDQGAFDAVIVRAFNDGTGGSGTGIIATNLTFHVLNQDGTDAKAVFKVDDSDFDGIADTVDIANGANDLNLSFVRIGTASQTFVVSSDPTNATVQPNPWAGGVSTFNVIETTTATIPANTGSGSVIARLVIPDNAGFTLTGVIAGAANDPSSQQYPSYNLNAVPEPATLSALGLAALGLVRRRK